LRVVKGKGESKKATLTMHGWCGQPDGTWLQFAESCLLLVQSILCFMALFRGMMGMQKSPIPRAKEPYSSCKCALFPVQKSPIPGEKEPYTTCKRAVTREKRALELVQKSPRTNEKSPRTNKKSPRTNEKSPRTQAREPLDMCRRAVGKALLVQKSRLSGLTEQKSRLSGF